MKHYGDITKINGAEVPIVDVICGGSPCQDLSVAGLRKGLEGERSGLFMEQIRIVKEQRNECLRQLQMRGADVDLRSVKPRFLIWENVPGALSSPGKKNGEDHKGEDFRCVLEEICRIADKTAYVPLPKDRKWSTSGCIVGNGWSVAWRLHDSQFWGVPQRRRRLSVVADFGSESAAEILFEREGMSGDSEQSSEKGQRITETVGNSSEKASNVFGETIMPTLVSRLETPVGNTQDGFNVISFQERAGKPGGGKGILIQDEKTASIRTQNNQSVCYGIEPGAARRLGGYITKECSPTLRANMGDNQVGVVSIDEKMGQTYVSDDLGNTLSARDYKQPQAVLCYGMDNERRRGPEEHKDESPTITAKCGTGGNNVPVVIEGNGSRPSHQGDGWKESEISYTLNSTEVHGVFTGGTVNVETEVTVRKYEVDKDKLIECIQNHRNMPVQTIAERLNKPKTLVEHWFRRDSCFAIPDPDVWMELKRLLEIETTEFDESIMTFETRPGTYDMRNRIHMGEVAPTLKAEGGNDLYCVGETYQKTTGALCASGYAKLGTQEAMNDMYVLSHGGFMVDADDSEVAHTLQATDYKDAQVVAYSTQQDVKTDE